MVAECDKVVARWGLRGTHSDLFMGVPASGKKVDVSGIFDTLGLMKQIGAVVNAG